MIFSSVLVFTFLYFPEDKTEYIPAVINLVIFSVLAYLAVRIFIRISKREEKRAKELEEHLKRLAQEKDS